MVATRHLPKILENKNFEKNTCWVPFWASNVLSSHVDNSLPSLSSHSFSGSWFSFFFFFLQQIRFVLVHSHSFSFILSSIATKTIHPGFPGSVSISNILPLSPLNKKFPTFYLENMVATITTLPSPNISHVRVTPSLRSPNLVCGHQKENGLVHPEPETIFLASLKRKIMHLLLNKFWKYQFRTRITFPLL